MQCFCCLAIDLKMRIGPPKFLGDLGYPLISYRCEPTYVLSHFQDKSTTPDQAYVTTFYMGKFSGETPKRHKLWSNDFRLLELIFGKAGYMSKVEQERCPGKTTRKYTDRHGKVRHVGIKDNLRNSQ